MFLSPLFASITSYEIIDIGVLSMDGSRAIAVNDQGQVLGEIENEGRQSIFLWDKDSGLQILKLPESRDLHLNNKGQIAGIRSNEVFIWDKATGFYNIGTFGINTFIKSFNDKGQLLIASDEPEGRIYLWDRGETKELSIDFKKQFPEYAHIEASAMNNQGEAILIATSSKDNRNINKSFLYSQNHFTELFKEYGKESSVFVRNLDDQGNMCVEIHFPLGDGYKNHFYFVNPSKGFQAELVHHSRTMISNMIIRNQSPQIAFCLPSELKKRSNGISQYTPGAEIRKLAKVNPPYWSQGRRELRICGQNSKGYVVGDMETIYFEKRHAFLAIPVGTKL